jgi:hypothetical protein
MQMAKIFKPIRWSHAARSGAGTTSPLPLPAEDDANRTGRVGTQPVTNMSPSGYSEPSVIEPPAYAEADEDAWLALLELVFDETGWPDAE